MRCLRLVNILTRSLEKQSSARAPSVPAFPNPPWLTARVSAKAPCHICIPPTGTIPRAESWTRSRNKRACSAAVRTTLCAISCCRSSSCSGTRASYHPFSPKAPGRRHARHSAVFPSAFWTRRLGPTQRGLGPYILLRSLRWEDGTKKMLTL